MSFSIPSAHYTDKADGIRNENSRLREKLGSPTRGPPRSGTAPRMREADSILPAVAGKRIINASRARRSAIR
ncbi:hypothetical protein BN2497_8419 [Janthinobacterium sp. CG23_2]|nr:hypothetical protein BN2497_8419 [Janthinobacterium sp. CG23_2]CUU30607.1 hypothetical protein BN3177_8419 [Janthinobacterium sp. CG23_2]